MSTSSVLHSANTITKISEILGDKAVNLLEHKCNTITRDQLHLPGPDFVERVWAGSDRPAPVLRNPQSEIRN